MNAEKKYQENSVAGLSVDNAGQFSILCAPSQGVGASQREGDSCKMDTLTLRGNMFMTSSQNMVRMLIILDKENQITAGTDLLQFATTSNAVFSPKTQNTRFDSKILLDRLFKIDLQHPQQSFQITIKVPFHINFIAGTTTIADNALKIVFFSQTPVAAGGEPQVNYISRVTYLDN